MGFLKKKFTLWNFLLIGAFVFVGLNIPSKQTVKLIVPYLPPTNHYISTNQEILKVYQDPYELTLEMRSLTNYIKATNPRIPKEVIKIIAWETITQAEQNGMNTDLLIGIMRTESDFHPMARSRANAKGLMQVLIEDGVAIDHNQVYDIRYNIQKGIEIFKSKLVKAKGNTTLALRYYVGDKYTDKYPDKVRKHIKKYKEFLTKG